MTSSLLYATINSIDVSNRVQKLVVTRRSLQGVGDFTIDLYNQDLGLTTSSFPVDSVIAVNLGASFGGSQYPFFGGYTDIADFINTQEHNSKNVLTLQVKGRDYGQDLQNKTVWGSDQDTVVNLTSNLLTYGTSPIVDAYGNPLTPAIPNPGSSTLYPYTNIGYTPQSYNTQALYDSQGRSYLSDVLKRLYASVNWDMYTDPSKMFHCFPAGQVSSGIQLWEQDTYLSNTVSVTAGTFQALTFTVYITNGQFKLTISQNGGVNPYWVINGLTIGTYLFDFGTSTSPVQSGYTKITESTVYSAGLGYGWTDTTGLDSRDRGSPNNIERDFVFGQPSHIFLVDIANGIYTATVIVGDNDYEHDNITVSIQNDNSRNNIIGPVHYQPADGTEVKNVIIGYGSSIINDSWTDLAGTLGGTNGIWNPQMNCVQAGITNYAGGQVITNNNIWIPYNTASGTSFPSSPTVGTYFIRSDQNNQIYEYLYGSTGYLWVSLGYADSTKIVTWDLPQAGVCSIKIVNNYQDVTQSIAWGLTFPNQFNWYLPLETISLGQIKWCLFIHDGAGTPPNEFPTQNAGYHTQVQRPGIMLQDSIGNVITYWFGGTYRYNQWLTFEVSVGWSITTEAQIWSTTTGKGTQLPGYMLSLDKWFYSYWSPALGNTGFNWEITKITFLSGANPVTFGTGNNYGTTFNSSHIDYVLFDALMISQIPLHAVADHSGTEFANGKPVPCQLCGRSFNPTTIKARQYPVTKTNITFQQDLNNYVETVANQRSNPVLNANGLYDANVPLSTCRLRADGRAGLINGVWMWYPGLNLSLNGSNSWRIMEITHTIERNVENTGFSHVVDLSLVPINMQIDLDQWSYNRYGDLGIIRQLHDRLSALENTYQLINPT